MGSNPDYRRATEPELLDGLRARSPLALAEAYHRSVPAGHAVARRLVGGAGEVEDVLLTVYRSLWATPPEAGTPLEGWVRRATWDAATARLRESGTAPAAPSVAALLPDLPTPEVRFLDAAERAIAELADDERRALLLAHDKGVPAAEQEDPAAADALARALQSLAGPETSSQDRTALHEDGCADVAVLGDWCLGLADPAAQAEAEEQMAARPGCAAKGRTLRRGRRRIEGLPATPDMGQRILVQVLMADGGAAPAAETPAPETPAAETPPVAPVAPVAEPTPVAEPAPPVAPVEEPAPDLPDAAAPVGEEAPAAADEHPTIGIAPEEAPPIADTILPGGPAEEPAGEPPSPWAPGYEPGGPRSAIDEPIDEPIDDDGPSLADILDDADDDLAVRRTDELRQEPDPASALDEPAPAPPAAATPDWTPEPGDTAELRLSEILGDTDDDVVDAGPPPAQPAPPAEPGEPAQPTGTRDPYAALRGLDADAEPAPPPVAEPSPAPVDEEDEVDVLAAYEEDRLDDDYDDAELEATAGRGGLAVLLAWVLPVLAGGAIGLLVALLVFQ